jgi:hypothetical protein
MFLLRSAFWLTTAFLLIKPGVDIETTASDVSGQMLASGRSFAQEQVERIVCTEIVCAGGRAVAAAMLDTPPESGAAPPPLVKPAMIPVLPDLPQATSIAVSHGTSIAPVPRPRPDWLG